MHRRLKDFPVKRSEKKLVDQIATLKKQLENLRELLKEYKKNNVIGPYNDQVKETIVKVKTELAEKQAIEAELKGTTVTKR